MIGTIIIDLLFTLILLKRYKEGYPKNDDV
jgi:hypothetical protein